MYLIEFKARIYVRCDLQPKTDEGAYASTLAFQVFRFLISLVALFDLETIQADRVNAFCNSPLDDEVYLYNPHGFDKRDSFFVYCVVYMDFVNLQNSGLSFC